MLMRCCAGVLDATSPSTRLCNQAPFSISLITLTLFFEAQNLLVNVAMLLLCQTSVKCMGRKLEGSFMHIVRLPLLLSFYRPVTRIAVWVTRIVFTRTRGWLNSQSSLLLGKLFSNVWQAMSLYRSRCSFVYRTKRGRKHVQSTHPYLP